MKKITVEEYAQKYQRYIELLLKKSPDEVITATPVKRTAIQFTVTLSDEEEKEFTTLDEYLTEYHSEFQNWEDFSDSMFMEAYMHTNAVKNNKPSIFTKEQADYITGLLTRDNAYKNNYANMFTNW